MTQKHISVQVPYHLNHILRPPRRTSRRKTFTWFATYSFISET